VIFAACAAAGAKAVFGSWFLLTGCPARMVCDAGQSPENELLLTPS